MELQIKFNDEIGEVINTTLKIYIVALILILARVRFDLSLMILITIISSLKANLMQYIFFIIALSFMIWNNNTSVIKNTFFLFCSKLIQSCFWPWLGSIRPKSFATNFIIPGFSKKTRMTFFFLCQSKTFSNLGNFKQKYSHISEVF